jgi:hypothetical protein
LWVKNDTHTSSTHLLFISIQSSFKSIIEFVGPNARKHIYIISLIVAASLNSRRDHK